MGVAVFCAPESARDNKPLFSVVNIITSDAVNKYDCKELSLTMSDHGQYVDKKQCGSSYV